jgi:hypothetical protein|nr:MAG TPA: phospholipase A2 [Caudoviricetes sp.]
MEKINNVDIDKTKTNGCGAMGGIFKFLKPPHHEFFRGECEVHDMLYEIGGTREDRLKADIELFQSMVKRSTSYFRDRSVGSQMWFFILSYIYYIAVRAFAGRRFIYKEINNKTNKSEDGQFQEIKQE